MQLEVSSLVAGLSLIYLYYGTPLTAAIEELNEMHIVEGFWEVPRKVLLSNV